MSLENAIFQTLAYSDIFDYPLTADELHRFLVVSASLYDIKQCAAKMKDVSLKDGYYFLASRDDIVELRRRREAGERRRQLEQRRIRERARWQREVKRLDALIQQGHEEEADPWRKWRRKIPDEDKIVFEPARKSG